jgi:tRNA threonylcarbamoyladenosine biosynthesis protein TsaE
MTVTDAVSIVVEVASPESMRALGRALGRAACAGDRFLLEGPFGAGKTTFVQGLAEGLDVPTPVSSPSFVIENQYRGRLVLYHVDLYRLERVEAELWESLEEHLYGDGVTAVEWAEKLPDPLREGATVLRFEVCEPARRVAFLSPDERLRLAAAAA